MKKSAIIFAAFFCLHTLHAQQQSGRITFERVINIHENLKPDQLQFKDMIPETVTDEIILSFNGEYAKVVMPGINTRESDTGQAHTSITTGSADDLARYIDPSSNSVYILQESTNGKQKLRQQQYDESRDAKRFQPGEKTKVILGFTCKQVMLKTKEVNFTLWVTDQLPFKGGLIEVYCPYGAVLACESVKWRCIAKDIKYEAVHQEEVAIPKALVK